MSISAASADELGKTEKELAQEKYDLEKDMNEALGYEADCSVETIQIAGEEHTVYTEVAEDEEDGKTKNASLEIIKNGFSCSISIHAKFEEFDDLLKYIEKAD